MSQFPAADLLDSAADWLEENDWCQYTCAQFETDDAPDVMAVRIAVEDGSQPVACCAAGALAVCTADDKLFSTARDALRDYVGWTSIPTWNDHPGRTKAEVVTALRGAAQKARA